MVLAVFAVGCGGGDQPSSPTAIVSTTPPVIPSPPTASSESSLETPSESPSATPTASEEDPSEEEQPEESPSGPVVLASGDSDRTLTMADIFSATGTWEESRYDVANRRDIQGIGVTLDDCGEYDAAELELRLARNFTRLSLSVGQANNSPSSDDVLVVAIVANGRQQDTRRVPFDRIQPFSVNVKDVNALKLRFWVDDEDCATGDVVAVVEKLTVFG